MELVQRHSVIHLFLFSLTAPAIKTIKLNIKLKSINRIRKSNNHDNPPQTGHTALQRAAAGGHLDIARLLVTQGASLDHQDELVRYTRADVDGGSNGDGDEAMA